MYSRVAWLLYFFFLGFMALLVTGNIYYYPDTDSTPVLDYEVRANSPWPGAYMRGSTTDGFQPSREYSEIAPSTGTEGLPVLGAYGSCVYSASTITNRTISDTCRSYIKLKYDSTGSILGCKLTDGHACSTAWNCQVATFLSSEPPRGVLDGDYFAFCGCNTEAGGISCPNNGICKTIGIGSTSPTLTANRLYDADLPISESNVFTERRVRRVPGECECASGFEHWTRLYTGYAPNDPRLSDTPGYVMPPLRGGDQVIMMPCSRVSLSGPICINGFSSFLYFPSYSISPFGTPITITQEIDYASVVPCFANETGLPGCGIDVQPCICPQGFFGTGCENEVFDNAHCGFADDQNPFNNFTVDGLCQRRGACAGAFVSLFSSIGGGDVTPRPFLQSPKLPLWTNTSLLYCHTCDAEFFGSRCQVTCGNSNAGTYDTPQCPDHATCLNNGTQLAPLPYCLCDAGYRDPNNDGHPGSPTNDSTICVTCTNELDVDVPGCNGQGICPLSTYTCFDLGCSGLTHRPLTPLKCICNSSFVDQACNIPNQITYTCGSQQIPVSCTYSHTSGSTDFKYTCTMNSILNTTTTPNERYPLRHTCFETSLLDEAFLLSDSQLRLLSGDDACAAIRSQCTVQNGNEDICPAPFRDFDVTTGLRSANAFCDPPVSRQLLRAVYAGDASTTVFCWLIQENPDLWSCQRSPIETPTFFISCVLAASWSAYATQPASFQRAILSKCLS